MTEAEWAELLEKVKFLFFHVKELELAFNKNNKQIQVNEEELTHAIIELRNMILPVLKDRAIGNEVIMNRTLDILEVGVTQKYLM